MAYFPNGSSAEAFSNECAECPLGQEPCPIALVQLQHNYDQIGNDLARTIMAELVSDSGVCAMRPLLSKVARIVPIVVMLLSLLAANPATGQGLGIDRLTPAIPSEGGRKAAAVASWATLGAGMGIDLMSDMAGCRGRGDCGSTAGWAAVRAGATTGAVLALKFAVHRTRPCAPDCGGERPDTSLPSGHTAYAFSATGGHRLEFTVPLAISTAGLRVAGGKHWLTDALAGAGIGWATSRIRGGHSRINGGAK